MRGLSIHILIFFQNQKINCLSVCLWPPGLRWLSPRALRRPLRRPKAKAKAKVKAYQMAPHQREDFVGSRREETVLRAGSAGVRRLGYHLKRRTVG